MNTAVVASAAPPTGLVHDVLPPQPVSPEMGQTIPVAVAHQQPPMENAAYPAAPPVHSQTLASSPIARTPRTPSDKPFLTIAIAIVVCGGLCAAAVITLA